MQQTAYKRRRNVIANKGGVICRMDYHAPRSFYAMMLMALFCSVPTIVFSADLLADEQGATAPTAVATVTANEDFLSPTYAIPYSSDPYSSESAPSNETTAVPSEIDILNEIFGSNEPDKTLAPQLAAYNAVPAQQFFPRNGVQEEKEETPLLTPLPPLSLPKKEIFVEPKVPSFKQPSTADQTLAMATMVDNGLAPREVRVSFYKDMSAFSVQALKWVRAFATRVVNDPTLLLSVRISDQNQKIQEKRLSILFQILKEVGVSAHQVRLYQSKRDENSILIGYEKNPDYTSGAGKKSKERVQKTIKW